MRDLAEVLVLLIGVDFKGRGILNNSIVKILKNTQK